MVVVSQSVSQSAETFLFINLNGRRDTCRGGEEEHQLRNLPDHFAVSILLPYVHTHTHCTAKFVPFLQRPERFVPSSSRLPT